MARLRDVVLLASSISSLAACGAALPASVGMVPVSEPGPASSAASAALGGAQAAGGRAAVAAGALGGKRVVPLALTGRVYAIPPHTSKLPDFAALKPEGTIYAAKLDVTPRRFDEGFPGVTDRVEWFAIDYAGSFAVRTAGKHRFRLTSDDGARLVVDGATVVDNDGTHPPVAKEGALDLAAGVHALRLSYFQGPRWEIALVLEIAEGDGPFHAFDAAAARPGVLERADGKVGVALEGEMLFDTDKADLKPGAEHLLEQVRVDLVDANPAARVVVEGHTDDRGDAAYNQDLSKRRARAVAAWLEAHGAKVPIEARGYGLRFPKVPNDSDANRARNRRVEVVVFLAPAGG